MKSRASILALLNILTFFAHDREIMYTPQGICTIGKMVFPGNKVKDISKELCFLEGFYRFCKEKGIKEGEPIIKVKNIRAHEGNSNEYCKSTNWEFQQSFFPQEAALSIFKEKSYGITVKKSHKMSPAMSSFVKEMIEKGRSANQN